MMKQIYAGRLDRLRQIMTDTATDLVAIGPSRHMAWLCGLDPHGDERPVMLLVSQDYAGVLIPALNAAAARAVTDLPLHEWADDIGPDQALAGLLERCDVAASGASVVVDETMRADFALPLLGMLNAPRHRFTQDTIAALRACKESYEREALQASTDINDHAVQATFAALRAGMTEREAQEIIQSEYRKRGAAAEFSLVCFGANSAFPHHHTGETRLEDGMAVLIDTGCRAQGYPSDMTRVGWFGTPDPKHAEVARVVDAAVDAALAVARPGVLASAVDRAARDVITAAGYGPQFVHRTGHGLGLDVHEAPYITATNDQPLAAGNVFTIEPGIYLEGAFGIRLEELVYLDSDGPQVLSSVCRQPVALG